MSPGAANLFPFFSEENNPLYLDPAERAANEACRTVALWKSWENIFSKIYKLIYSP